jgi:hypothetical protein
LLPQLDPTQNEILKHRIGNGSVLDLAENRGGEKRKNVMPKPQTSRPEIGCSICCTNCCTEGTQEHPKTPQNACTPPTLHDNIRMVGSFRNRQVTSSTLVVGSIFFPAVHAG